MNTTTRGRPNYVSPLKKNATARVGGGDCGHENPNSDRNIRSGLKIVPMIVEMSSWNHFLRAIGFPVSNSSQKGGASRSRQISRSVFSNGLQATRPHLPPGSSGFGRTWRRGHRRSRGTGRSARNQAPGLPPGSLPVSIPDIGYRDAGTGGRMDEVAVRQVDADVPFLAPRTEKHEVARLQRLRRNALPDPRLALGVARQVEPQGARIQNLRQRRAVDPVSVGASPFVRDALPRPGFSAKIRFDLLDIPVCVRCRRTVHRRSGPVCRRGRGDRSTRRTAPRDQHEETDANEDRQSAVQGWGGHDPRNAVRVGAMPDGVPTDQD